MSAVLSKLKEDVSAKKLESDRSIKAARMMSFQQKELSAGSEDSNYVEARLEERLKDIQSSWDFPEGFQCPKVRYGRTELHMPIVTLGGMRQQETWGPKEDLTIEEIDAECQLNFEMIADHAMKMGVNHFETARGYGSSELQFGPVIKKYSRSSIILQTKVPPKPTNEEFRTLLEKSFSQLQLDEEDSYIDLFGFHGINKPEHLEYIMREGGNMEVIEEYKKKGKIRHVGFSTHGMTDCIVKAIETNAFDYVNLHLHFIGSYTASGTGTDTPGNLDAVKAAKERDMGIFVISPTDKGGALYEPPKALASLCAAQGVSPITMADLWIWNEGVHTFTIGAARPADIDEHLHAASLADRATEITDAVIGALTAKVDAAFGPEFKNQWWKGLPSAYDISEGVPVAHIYWLWWLCKAWGMHHYAIKRYGSLEGNVEAWEKDGLASFSWVPGVSYRPERDEQLRACLGDNPKADHIMDAIKEVHQWCSKGGCLKRGEKPIGDVDASEWEIAYNLQPDVPYPER
jgi:predicted aldo/keto reductase-like oxidoreductase